MKNSKHPSNAFLLGSFLLLILGLNPLPVAAQGTADLSVTITATPNPVVVGGNLTYQVTITNRGPDTAQGHWRVSLSMEVFPVPVFLAKSGNGFCFAVRGVNNIFGCDLAPLASGATATARVQVNFVTAGTAVGTADVTPAAGWFDPDLTNNSASLNTVVRPVTSDLSMGIAAGAKTVGVGQNLTYSVTVTNLGPDTAQGHWQVLIAMEVSPVPVFLAKSGNGICFALRGVISGFGCELAPLASGATATARVQVNFVTAGTAVGTADVTPAAGWFDPDPTNNSVSFTTTARTNKPPMAKAGPDKNIGVATLGIAAFTLDGSGSSDPDGDPLTFLWRDANGNKVGNTAQIALLRAQGTHTFTLTVDDGLGGTASDSVLIAVLSDTTPPLVIPPDDRSVSKTESGGARGVDSAKLAAFLAGGQGVDDFDLFLTRLNPQVGSVDVDNTTLFPIGPTAVTFRFADNAGNIGTETATVRVVDLQDDDLFVGAADSIYKVRGTTVTTFCASVPNDPLSWDTADEVLVDSQGRVTFLANLSLNPVTFGPLRRLGLFRCDFEGATPQLLAVFGTGADQPRPTEPVPFPGELFTRVSGLHLSRLRSIVIDDSVNGGRPKLSTDDAYVFSTHNFPDFISFVNTLFGPPNTRRYRVSSGMWEKNPESPKIITEFFNCIFCPTNPGRPAMSPDVVYHQGATYSAANGAIGKDADPFRVEVHAKIAGLTVRLGLALFGGYHQFDGFYDDQRYSNTAPSNCPPPAPQRTDLKTLQMQTVRDFIPVDPTGFLQGLGSFASGHQITFDEYGSFGLVLTGPTGPFSRALVNISEKILDDPLDWNHFFRVCPGPVSSQALIPVLDVTSILDFYDPNSPTAARGAGADRLTSAPSGLRGTQLRVSGGTVVSISSAGATPIVSGLAGASGIAAWPPGVSPGTGIVVVIRVDSPVNVLLTDANGKRLGVDASGQAVNDFGSDGFDSGPGDPRFFAIQNPAAGNYAVQSVGTGTGPFTVHVYTADLSKPLGEHIFTSGTVSPGDMGKHDFTLDAAGALTFSNQLPIANAGTDQTVNADASGNATVALDGALSSDPDGDPLSFIWSGPFGSLTGPQVNALLPVGIHSLTLTVDDGKGGFADANVVITVNAVTPPADTTPPVLTLPGNIVREATSPSGAAVSYIATANDAVDGPITPSCAPASGSTFALGTTAVNCTATDASSNTASGSFNVTVVDTTAPVVTGPAGITIPATEAGGARGNASAALAAFLAGGTAVDNVDPSPTRLSPQVGGVNVDNTMLFALGVTTPVTFSFRDASGNVGMANASVTVVLGTPRISAAVIGKGVDASGARYVDLQLTNTGTGNARNVKINQLPLRTLSGSGTVSYNTTLSPALPISIGSLDVGGPKTVRLFFNVPATVTRYSLTESGTLQDVAATNYSFSASQSVIP